MKATEVQDDSTLEQSQETVEAPHVLRRDEVDPLHKLASQLISQLDDVPDGDMVGEIVANAMKLLRDQTNRGDIKLINKSLKELRYAMKVFAPYRTVRKVSIFGSARTPEEHPDYVAAERFGKLMAQGGWMVITGAGGGIMAAGHGGAGAEPSFGLAIRLPFEQKTNPFIEKDKKLINFKYFFTRKLMFLRSSDAIALFPGGFGTMDEGFEVLTLVQTGKSVPCPIIMIDQPGGTYWHRWHEYVVQELLARGLINKSDLALYKITDNLEDAVDEIRHFYSNYHSIRYSKGDLVIRLQHKPTDEQLVYLAEHFADIKMKGDFTLAGPLPIERDEPALSNLTRLVFTFNRRDHGRLRMMINYLNDLPAERAITKGDGAMPPPA